MSQVILLGTVFWNLLVRDNLGKDDTILMLQWLSFAKRPLEPAELYFAVRAGTDTKDMGAWDRKDCRSENSSLPPPEV